MSISFSRVAINPAARAARRALSSPEVLHAIVMRAFGSPSSEPHRTLWRLDRSDSGLMLFVTGPGKPEPGILGEQLGVAVADIGSFAYDRFLSTLAAGQEWQFRLRANPTKALRQPSSRSKRLPLIKEDDQLAWLIRQGEQHGGFEIPRNRLAVPEVVIGARGIDEFRRQDATVTLGTAVFDGILRVMDAEMLRSALIGGLGRGKAYGCGLLTLAPAPRSA